MHAPIPLLRHLFPAAVAWLALAASASVTRGADADAFFAGDHISRIEIRLAEGAADRLRDDPRSYVPCTLTIDADAFKTASGDLESSLRLICQKVHAYGDVKVGR